MGDGPLLNPARSLATMLGIQNKCIFKGKVQNVLEYMGASDLKLLLSAQESFGLVLLEAFSQGIPCVATNVGGIPEVLDDGVQGASAVLPAPVMQRKNRLRSCRMKRCGRRCHRQRERASPILKRMRSSLSMKRCTKRFGNNLSFEGFLRPMP